MTASSRSLSSVVIRFAGDSGDGMQLTGTQFTNTSALVGNDLATLPDYPAEIRAPAGTRAGVSGFQVQISDRDIFTPGDQAHVLVAMNPAALVANIGAVQPGGTVIVNVDKFVEREFAKAQLESDPLETSMMEGFRLIRVPLGRLVRDALKELPLGKKEVDRCKNFFALGLTYWLYSRPLSHTESWIESKFKSPYKEANLLALNAGWNYAENLQLFQERYEVRRASLPAGTYRNLTGNQATALGLVAAARKADLPMMLGSYPITPASDLLHNLARYKNHGVSTLQAEDEIAAVCAAIGASWGGTIGVTSTSGPGLALKGEAVGLAVMTELPLVIVDVQRGGPSTGLPTKTEQSDLLFALYGRNGEAPVPVIAAATPADCFAMAYEATRMALEYMTPVLLLTDGYLANGSEPWRLPASDELPPIRNRITTENNNGDAGFLPYLRDAETLARSWALPGTPGLAHRIGGLEKEDLTGNVSYDPANHEKMCRIRAAKVDGIQVPDQDVFGDEDGILVIGWGSTFGAIRQAVILARMEGKKVGHAHLRHLRPFPANLGALMERYETVLVPEMNLGQLNHVLRDHFLRDVVSVPKIQGQPFRVGEIKAAIDQHLQEA